MRSLQGSFSHFFHAFSMWDLFVLAIIIVVLFHTKIHVQYVATFAGIVGLTLTYEFLTFPVFAKINTTWEFCKMTVEMPL